MAAPVPARGMLLATVLTALVASPVSAVDTVPPEAAVILPGNAIFGAIVGDVDGDGVRELVRLVPWEVNPGQLAVEVISIDGGVPRSRGQELIRRAATPDDTFAGRNPDDRNLLPVGAREPARLIAWQLNGNERVLVASIGTSDLRRPCCLTLWEVTLAGDAMRLEFVQDTVSSAAWVLAVDLDADGTDELVVVETADPARPETTRVVVLSWNGADFDRRYGHVEPGLIAGPVVSLGDSDGLPGEEVGFPGLPGRFDQVNPFLHRISLNDGEVVTERAVLPDAGSVLSVPGPGRARLALVSARGVRFLDWPTGAEEVTPLGTSSRGGEPLGALGEGDDARLLILRGGAIDVLDPDLQSREEIAGGLAANWFAGSSRRPYAGPLPGGDEAGRPAMVFNGRLIVAAQGTSSLTFREVASLPGRTPVGLFGVGLGWAAVADGVALPAERRGGSLGVAAGVRATAIAVLPVDELLRPEEDGGLLTPPLTGAVAGAGQPARPILLTSGDVHALVSAPAGSTVEVVGQGSGVRESIVDISGTASVAVSTADPDARNDESFTARLLVSTPAGHGYGAIWEVRVLRRAPSLTADTPMAPLSFSVPISGRTSPSAELLVDGARVEVRPDGTFQADVSAGPWPRTVRLRATDRVGNSSEVALSVVGVLDYRRLPWIPIVAVLTLLTGAALFLRAPKPVPRHAGSSRDDGTLEEIE